MHAMNWHMGMALGGIRLQVPDSQLVRALEVLDDFAPDDAAQSGEDESEIDEVDCCPECDSLEIREVSSSSPRQIALWSAAIPFPEPPADQRRRWKCMACGYQWEDSGE
jgi:hypothetical protein